MKNRYARVFAAVTAAAVLAGCNNSRSSQSFVPGTSSFGNFSWSFRHGVNRETPFPTCSATSYNAPGTFTVLAALGSFSGTSFSGSGLSLWGTFKVPKGTGQLPKSAPNLGSTYTLYYGTYKLGAKFTGCFYLAKVSQTGISFDGAAAAWPNLHDFGSASPLAQGPLTISISGISARHGSGTVTLKDVAGKTLSTGSVTITGSKVIK
jgi:hypothetical protein